MKGQGVHENFSLEDGADAESPVQRINGTWHIRGRETGKRDEVAPGCSGRVAEKGGKTGGAEASSLHIQKKQMQRAGGKGGGLTKWSLDERRRMNYLRANGRILKRKGKEGNYGLIQIKGTLDNSSRTKMKEASQIYN